MNLIFGGSGFVGQNLIANLATEYQVYDIIKSKNNFHFCDVRNKINIPKNFTTDSVIYNFAALCTIPKYEEYEYYETNVKGALNICDFARANNINTIIFTSSISPYGVREAYVDEESVPMPNNEYGISKLIAEHIHLKWHAEAPNDRKLIILRPGIVFGKNENGNFTRLYKAMRKGLFFYPGRNDTKKASIYVKDLVKIMLTLQNESTKSLNLVNACYPKAHSIKEICQTIAKVTHVRNPKIIIPGFILILFSNIIVFLGKLLKIKFMGIHPDRINKLMISTNVSGKKLENIYKIKYSMEEAISDWFHECDKKGLF